MTQRELEAQIFGVLQRSEEPVPVTAVVRELASPDAAGVRGVDVKQAALSLVSSGRARFTSDWKLTEVE